MAGKSSSIIEELEKAPAGAITELYVDLSTINASVKFLNKYFFPPLKIFLNKHISFITKITLHSTEKTLHSRVPLVLQILLEIWQPHIVLVLHSFRVETFNNTCIDLLKKNLTEFQCVELKNPEEILHKKLLPILNKLLTLEKNCKLITSQKLAQIPDTITELELKELSRDEIQYVFLNTPNQVTKIYLKNLDEEALDFVLSNLKLICDKFEIDYSSLLPELQEKFKITKLSLSVQATTSSTSEILTNLNEGTLPSNKFAISSLLNNSSAQEAATPTNNSSNFLVHPIQTPSPSFSKKISDVHRKRLFKCIMDYTNLLQTILDIPNIVKKERNFFEEIFKKFPWLADIPPKEFNNLTEIIFKEIEIALRQRKRVYDLERLVKYIMDYSSLLKRILGDRRLFKEESQTFRKMFESFPRLADRSSKEFNNLTEIIFKEIEKALRQRKRVCELDMTTLLLALGNQTVDSASFKFPTFPAMSGPNVSSPFTSNFPPSLYSNPPILNFSSAILMPNPIHQNNYISTPLIPTTSSAATSKTSIYEKQLGIYQRKLNMFFQYASSKKKDEDAANIQKLADGLKEAQKNDSFKSIPFEADINQLLNEVENSLAQDIPIKLLESDINQLLSKFSKLQPPLIKALPPASSSRSKSQLYQVHPMSSSKRPTGSSITKATVKPTTKRPRIGN